MSNPASTLSPAELAHYSRQLGLEGFGLAGQQALKHASVLIVGVGGLGSPCALYLAAAGIGRLGLIDFDVVEASNLHRQVLFGAGQVGLAKIDCAADRLRELNPHIDIETHPQRLSADNARALVRRYDIVADGADNFPTRYLTNDACVLENRPLVSASILGFEGQLSVYHYAGGPCYRCLYPQPPPPGSVPSCAEGGVLGVLPGILGSLQALEVIKCITGIGDVASGVLLHLDALSLQMVRLSVPNNPDCPICSAAPTQTGLVDYEQFCAGSDMTVENAPEITPADLVALLTLRNDVVLVDVRETHERALDALPDSVHVPLGTALVDGVPYDKECKIVVYCAAGGRSMQAANSLLARGYRDVLSLATGLGGFRQGEN